MAVCPIRVWDRRSHSWDVSDFFMKSMAIFLNIALFAFETSSKESLGIYLDPVGVGVPDASFSMSVSDNFLSLFLRLLGVVGVAAGPISDALALVGVTCLGRRVLDGPWACWTIAAVALPLALNCCMVAVGLGSF